MSILAVALAVAACDAADPGDGEFLACEGKCDASGALSVSRRWVPVDGFVRVVVAAGHELTVEPATGVSIDGSGTRRTLELSAPGFYTLRASKDGQPAGALALRVSDDGPQFTVRAPAAGAFVALHPGDGAAVEGTVRDPLGGALRLSLGGHEVPVAADGAFRATLPTVFGVNFVELTATDDAGNRFVYSHGFLVAPRFGRVETTVNVAASEALLDLVAARLSPMIPQLVHVGAQAEPIADPLAHRIFFDGATLPGQDRNPGGIVVGLDSLDGALRTTLDATGDLVARAHVDNWVLADTHIVATASDLAVDATVAFAGGLEAEATALSLDFSSFDLAIGSIPGWLPGLFVEAAKGIIGRVIKGRVGPIVGDVLASLEGDFEPALVHPCLSLETPFALAYRLGGVAPRPGRLGLTLGASARHAGAEGPGAPWREERAAAAPAGGQMAVAVGGNLLNQFMYELWHAGALEIELTEADLGAALATVPVVAALDPVLSVHARLGAPPVVEAGQGGQVRVSFGELRLVIRLDVSLFQITIEANVGARADVALEIAGGAVRVLPTVRELHLDLGRRTFAGLNPEAVEALVRAIAPELAGRIAGALEAFRLPEIDLASAGLPGVRLGIDSGRVHAGDDGFAFTGEVSVLTGAVEPSAGPGCPAVLR